MAELLAPPDGEGFLAGYYAWLAWKALEDHAPRVLAELRELGPEGWAERYGSPPALRELAEEFCAHGVVLGPSWADAPPQTPPPPALPPYDPSFRPRERWRARALEVMERYRREVEEAYLRAGWRRVRLKYRLEHFTWWALHLEGLTYPQIAERLGLAVGEDTVRKGVEGVWRLLAGKMA